MARDDPSAESTSALSSSTTPTSLDTVAQTAFECSVVVRDLERDSLSRKYDGVQCFIAHDDAASVNLYIDQRDGLDYLHHRLTDNIRHVYAGRGRNVNVQLSSKRRLEIVLQSDESKRHVFELLSKVEMRELNYEHFPKVIPKSKVTKVEPSKAYLTANDVWTQEVEMTTPPRLRKHGSGTPLTDDHYGKKARTRSSMSYRSQQAPLSSPSYDDLPVEWNPPSSPLLTGFELMTPSNSRTLDQAIDQMPPISCSPPFTSKGTLLEKLSAYAPQRNQRRASLHDRGTRSGVARRARITYADSMSSSRCADAVLQAVLGLEVIKRELCLSHWLTTMDNEDCLFRSIVDVCSQRTRECIPLKTDRIKQHVAKRTSSSNPLNSQDEDAQVFLEELLNQSRQDIRARIANEYPFVGKFECDIDHRIVCMACGKKRVHTEQNQILSLDLQERTRTSKRKVATIQSLLPQFFNAHEISFYCEACDGEKAMAHRTVSRLPKVLVLHLKRFQRDEHGQPWTNDEPVTLEDTLLLDRYCQTEALEAALRHDESLDTIPTTPSDGFPSSDGSRYSSNSPSRSYHARTATISSQLSSTTEPDDMSFDAGGGLYPAVQYIQDSDEDDSLSRLQPEIHDLVDDSDDEELQFRWAIEESIRAQSFSHPSISNEEHEASSWAADETLTESIYEDIRALTSNDLSFMTDVQESMPPATHSSTTRQYQQRRSGTSTPTIRAPQSKMILPELFAMTNSGAPLKPPDTLTKPKEEEDVKDVVGVKLGHDPTKNEKMDDDDDLKKGFDRGGKIGKDSKGGKEDDDDNDSDADEDLKRAIQASLQPSSPPPVSEKDIKEQEDRDIEEAIRRSLLDQEDNKENISPEEFEGRKKGKKGGAGVGGGGKGTKSTDYISSNKLSFSQPVGKRDLDLSSNGRRSGNDLKRVQLRRSNTTDVSSMLMSSRTRSGSNSINDQSPFHQAAASSSSSSLSSSQPVSSPSIHRAHSGHFEYNLRNLESRIAKKGCVQEASSSSSVAKGNSSSSLSRVTKPITPTTPKKGERTRPISVASSNSSASASAPPTPTTPTTPKSAYASGSSGSNSAINHNVQPSSSRQTAAATVNHLPNAGSRTSQSTIWSATGKNIRTNSNGTVNRIHQDSHHGPDDAAIRPPGDEADRAGLYRLRAVVSKPNHTSGNGISSGGNGQQAGHYICDSLGSDGVWRCFDQQTVRRIGSWANMDQQRERIGYLVIYVHTV